VSKERFSVPELSFDISSQAANFLQAGLVKSLVLQQLQEEVLYIFGQVQVQNLSQYPLDLHHVRNIFLNMKPSCPFTLIKLYSFLNQTKRIEHGKSFCHGK
jgi:hypothetical protein